MGLWSLPELWWLSSAKCGGQEVWGGRLQTSAPTQIQDGEQERSPPSTGKEAQAINMEVKWWLWPWVSSLGAGCHLATPVLMSGQGDDRGATVPSRDSLSCPGRV